MNKAYIQYSKRIVVAVLAYWCAYRLVLVGALLLMPALADAMILMLEGVDHVMIASLGLYTGNSVAEKGLTKYYESKQKGEHVEESNG